MKIVYGPLWLSAWVDMGARELWHVDIFRTGIVSAECVPRDILCELLALAEEVFECA